MSGRVRVGWQSCKLPPNASNSWRGIGRGHGEKVGVSLRIRSTASSRWAAMIVLLALVGGTEAAARGVSPYLPLNMSPEMDRKIQRVLVLGGRTVMRRPVPAAVVLEALPRACQRDEILCSEVRAYLERYMKRSGVVHLRATGAITDGDSKSAQPNAHGAQVDDAWAAQVGAYYQPNDYLLFSVGGFASDDEATPTGSMLSFGTEYVQLDLGYRDHWLSPLGDSSSLIGTQAPTMPSITLSNYKPIGRFGISYEVFAARMSRQENFPTLDGADLTSGYPRLAGLQGSIAPAEGLAFGVNRITQYGGGARNQGWRSDLFDALTSSNNPNPGQASEFGNRVASLTSSIVFSGRTPFAVHMEYAGEDNAVAQLRFRLRDLGMAELLVRAPRVPGGPGESWPCHRPLVRRSAAVRRCDRRAQPEPACRLAQPLGPVLAGHLPHHVPG
jgi:hypothetical protein